MHEKNVIAILLARGGSEGIPRKNLVNLCGKPLLYYTIIAAQKAKSVNRIVLSTEDREIAAVARKYGTETIIRPSEYATETSHIQEALRFTVRELEKGDENIDIVVALYGNVPIRKDCIIDKVIGKMIMTNADSVQTYAPYRTPPQWAYKIQDDEPTLLDEKNAFAYRRQLVEQMYYPDGAVLAFSYNALMNSGDSSEPNAFYGNVRRAVIQSPEDTVDVDNPIDLLWAEFLLRKMK